MSSSRQPASVRALGAAQAATESRNGAQILNTQAPTVKDAVRAAQGRKYKNVPTYVDGVRFDSKKEAARFAHLRMMEQASVISRLEVHPRFPLVVHGEHCGDYVADFGYLDADGKPVIEDVKSAVTRKLPTYRLKVRMVWALYGLRVEEQ